MRYSDSDDFQLYLGRIRPIYHQLFNIAHAVTGSCDLAEYCLQCAFLNYWVASTGSGSRRSFREGLRNTLIQLSLREAAATKEAHEYTWTGFTADDSDPLSALIGQEAQDMQRILALKYGCRLSRRRIARLMGTESARIRTLLNRFEARARRRLPAAERRNLDSLLARSVRANFAVPSALAPDMGNVFRTFEADAVSITTPSRLPARIFGGITVLVLAILCIAVFWLTAVLLQPAVLENPQDTEIAETAASE